ncbi:histidine kinase [Roseimarinus sediminis]|uniref:histidine kinase n=1 Tax=Roseimarinus sediminis TaxID=1610899 RepID=UPI003D25E6E9
MKTMAFLFMFVSVFAFASTEFPELNLETGKRYHIETISHVDTSASWLYRKFDQRKWILTPIAYDTVSKTYTIEAVLDYYKTARHDWVESKGWQEIRDYETGYHSILASPLVALNKTKKPIIFTISKSGIISGFDYRKSGQSIDRYEMFSKTFEASFQQLFFHNNALAQQVAINDSTVSYRCEPSGKDGTFISRTVELDRASGLIIRQYHNELIPETSFEVEPVKDGAFNHSLFFQKYVPLYRSNYKYFDDRSFVGSENDTVNVMLKGTIFPKVMNEDTLIVYFSKQKYFRVPLNRDGSFEAAFYLSRPMPLLFIYPDDYLMINTRYSTFRGKDFGIHKNQQEIILSPGDHIEISLREANHLIIDSIAGRGWNEVKYSTMINSFLSKKDYSGSFNDFFHKYLYEWRDLIDPSIYLMDLFQYQYRQVIIHDELHDAISKDVLVNNSLALNSIAYFYFLYEFVDNALENQISQSTGVDFDQNVNEFEFNYFMGQYSLKEPVKSNYAAFCIYKLLNTWYWPTGMAEELFPSFERNFSETPVFEAVNRMYKFRQLIRDGNPAPEFKVNDINGEELALSDFEGKVVVLNLMIPGRNRFEYLTKHIFRKIKESYLDKSDEVVLLNVFLGSESEIQKLLVMNQLPGIVAIDSSYPNSELFEMYQVEGFSRITIIDRNGNISGISRGIKGEEIMDAIQMALSKPYHGKNEYPFWIRVTLIVLSGIIILISMIFLLYRGIMKRRLQKSEFNKKMRELELTAIRAQMNPHFMYNCLNSIQNMVQQHQNEAAHLYLSKFASLIRRTLNTSRKDEVSLHEELEAISEYIDLEKLRFDFSYVMNIDESVDVYSVFVPPMLLQPFIENALLHGLLPKKDNRKIVLKVWKEENRVKIDLRDNGIGRKMAAEISGNGNGKGLLLSKERLKLLSRIYGTDYEFYIEDLKDENNLPLGTKVSFCFTDEQ